MGTPARRPTSTWLTWLGIAALAAASGCGNDNPPTQPTPTPTPPIATPTVTAGRITQAPAGVGLVLATTFTFKAEGFAASDNSTLSYAWDFGDGARETGATVSHLYPGRGVFTVSVTASTASGASAVASLPGVAATTVDGRWGLQDVTGTFIVHNTVLSQNGTSLTGDDTALNCRFAVTGSVRAQRGITVNWTRARNDCQAFNVPETITFTGEAEEAAGGFLGTLDTGTPARLVACTRPSCA